MNLFAEVDAFFRTPEQRYGWIRLLACLLCLWQLVWLFMIGCTLMTLNGSESLMNLYSNLEQFSSSWLARFLMRLAQSRQMSLTFAVQVFSKSADWSVILLILLVVLIGFSRPFSWKKKILLLCALIVLVLTLVFGALAMASQSLNEVAYLLKGLGACLLLPLGISIVVCLLEIPQSVQKIDCDL